ncbi:MAG: M20/M25/M40 family metallo-hydrolase [Actinomycetota bacterium]|nr:M20/M25/M40 family metallo-hydrolase [Actinomycetota bacterium]
MHRPSTLVAVGAGTVLTAALIAPAFAAAPTDTTELRDEVTVEGVRDHQRALQRIANRNDDTRASGTPGYDASADYVAEALEDAGYTVARQEFTFDLFRQEGPSTLALSPAGPSEPYVDEEDFLVMEYSGTGTATGALQAVDVTLPPPAQSGSTSGCEATDFAGFTAGNIAVIQRGTCTFRQKADNAAAAGAVGAIIFNEGQEGRTELLSGTLSQPQVGIPVLGTTFALGEELVAAEGSTATMSTDVSVTEDIPTENVIADSTWGRTDRTVMAGAHLDSVLEGPGINDNGSGVGAILETAEQLADQEETENAVRFAFWGAEESGLIGSQHYVDSLSARALKDIMLYLNFDMVGSPNFVRFVYDGDGSTFGVAGPTGSGHIEDTFNAYFASQGLASEPTQFDGRSDYDAFINAGVPAGGLFTGAEGIKTEEQAAVYGGTAGVAYDPCYHAECDDFRNVSIPGLDQMSDAVAHATLVYADSQSTVTGTAEGSGGGPTQMRGHHRVR